MIVVGGVEWVENSVFLDGVLLFHREKKLYPVECLWKGCG